MVAECWLTDSLLELAVDGIVVLGVSSKDLRILKVYGPRLAENGDGFLWNIWIKHVSVVEQL